MGDFLKKVTADRIAGDRPSAPRALAAAIVVGVLVAVISYKLLRAES